ncbi:NAD(P)/FAD-dependent oxidoreductase [Candidatus Protochlamydia phocaeensis]|uniref:NAD(P)/FAD-dependent oxidoreductase n=1 Tax=Candidatus Protochlamydia phocaeensis TaxID=1414722 RepID=UPI0008394FD0|nr:NAD(P)/FAD-dependent oxidoreductase [Candidatus Protochlamydia phocaeensis]
MKTTFTILGGGVAGLCAAIRLAELGADPLLIEAGIYPSHKVCGEFLSPSCLPLLERWQISPILLSHACFRTPSRSFTFSFPSPAGSLSHWQLDPALAAHAQKLGVQLLTSTKVEALTPASGASHLHELTLESGQIIRTAHLLIATGRLPGFSPLPSFRYMGLKAHFKGLPIENALEMFAFPGAYLGISPIENGHFNIACLARLEHFQQAESSDTFIHSLRLLHPVLDDYLSKGENLFSGWMQAPIPELGMKAVPNWPNAYFIGDAAGTIPPACGNGLAMAIASGCLAAEYALRGDEKGFKHAWKKRYQLPIRLGKYLHQLMMHPAYGNFALQLSQFFPSLANAFFNFTR